MSDAPVLYYMLRISSHVSIDAGVNWYPWTDHPARVAAGWEAVPHRGGPTIYCYLVPDLMSPTPKCHVHMGEHGDPDRDPVVSTIEVSP